MTTGQDIVVAARGWLGTRFHHQGRLKKTAHHTGGVDCLGLLMGVAGELALRSTDGKLLTDYDRRAYAHYPDSAHLVAQLHQLLCPVNKQHLQAGDILIFSIDYEPHHLAIVAPKKNEYWHMIHAYAPARMVVEHALDSWWHEKIHAAFRIISHSK